MPTELDLGSVFYMYVPNQGGASSYTVQVTWHSIVDELTLSGNWNGIGYLIFVGDRDMFPRLSTKKKTPSGASLLPSGNATT